MAASKVKNIARRWLKDFAFKLLYPAVYKICCLRRQQRELTLFCEVRHGFLTDSYLPIYERLRSMPGQRTRVFFIHNNSGGFSYLLRYLRLCTILPTAGTILVDDTCNLFGAFRLRQGTKLIQTWHSCGAFKKWGYSLAGLSFGQQAQELDRYPAHRNYTLVTVSSEECIAHFNEAFGFKGDSCVRATGVARTDYFFDEKNRRQAFSRLLEHYPQAKGRRLILYAPTYRGDADKAQPPQMFDIEALRQCLDDNCFLLIKQHGFVREKTPIPKSCSGFAADVSDTLRIEELLFTADICITDYSSLIFEYSLFERPMVFYACDLEEFYDYRGFYYKYDRSFLPGEITQTQEELFAAVKNALSGGADRQEIRRFRQRFMGACDGKSTERIVDYITKM